MNFALKIFSRDGKYLESQLVSLFNKGSPLSIHQENIKTNIDLKISGEPKTF